MSDHRCMRCKHDVRNHARNGGPCQYEAYTCERVYDARGVLSEIIEDVTVCDCLYLMLGA